MTRVTAVVMIGWHIRSSIPPRWPPPGAETVPHDHLDDRIEDVYAPDGMS